MLGEPLSMLVPQVVGFRLTGALPRGRDGDRPRADRDRAAAQDRRRRQVRRVLRRRARRRSPLADRATLGNMSPEYGATCGFFPVDERDARLPAADGPQRRAGRARRGVLQGEPALARAGATTRRTRRSSSSTSATSSRRSPGRGGRRTACRSRNAKEAFLEALGTFGVDLRERDVRQEVAETFPASDPPTEQGRRRATAPSRRRRSTATLGAASAVAGRRRGVRARARLGRDRRDHVVHEHVEPAGDDRRRPAREEGGRARPRAAAVGEVVARPRLAGRHRLLRARRPRHATSTSSASTRSATAARPASATRARCPSEISPRSPRATSSPAPCSPATATSRRASTPR